MATNFLIYEKALNEYKKISSLDKLNESCSDDDSETEQTEIEEECEHESVKNISGVIICEVCGKELEKTIYLDKEWRFYGQSDSKRASDPTRVQPRKIDEKNIYKDVENMGFSDKVISLANEIFQDATKGHILRGNSRKSIIFSCIFHAYKITKNPQSQEKLSKQFGITRRSSIKGLKYVKLKSPKDSLVHQADEITPLNLVDDIMDVFNASDKQKKEVYEIYYKIKNKSTKINRSRPQSIASALVYYWISHKRIDISIKDFAKKAGLSDSTIIRLAKEIALIVGGDIPENLE